MTTYEDGQAQEVLQPSSSTERIPASAVTPNSSAVSSSQLSTVMTNVVNVVQNVAEPSIVSNMSLEKTTSIGANAVEMLIGNTLRRNHIVPVKNAAWVEDSTPVSNSLWTHNPAANFVCMENIVSTDEAKKVENTLSAENDELPSSSASTISRMCSICEDRATGKHYGAISCDGCKGFFRRSIRKMHTYFCRYSKNCQITRSHRNKCRYCRLQKCLLVGMKATAVQIERDRISWAPLCKDLPPRTQYSVKSLLRIELNTRKYYHQNPGPVATVSQIFESMRMQLLDLVKWAKLLPMFLDLIPEDQVTLLRENAGGHLLLNLAYRSIHHGDVLLLRNNFIIPRFYENASHTAIRDLNGTPNLAISHIANSILDTLVTPLANLNLDDTEIACLKAVLFFHPGAPGLTSVARIRGLQNEIQTNLENYLYANRIGNYDDHGRFGSLLLLLPVLKSLSGVMIRQIQALKIFGVPVDNLLLEMLLGEYTEVNE